MGSLDLQEIYQLRKGNIKIVKILEVLAVKLKDEGHLWIEVKTAKSHDMHLLK